MSYQLLLPLFTYLIASQTFDLNDINFSVQSRVTCERLKGSGLLASVEKILAFNCFFQPRFTLGSEDEKGNSSSIPILTVRKYRSSKEIACF